METRPGVAARTAGAMLLTGALLSAVTVALPHASHGAAEGDGIGLLARGVAAVLGLVLLLAQSRIPHRALPWFAALGTLLITGATKAAGVTGSGAGDNEVLYLLVVVYAAYFLSRRQALLQLGLVGLAYGWLLFGELGLEGGLNRWLTTMVALSIATPVIGRLNDRVEGLIDRLEAMASRDPLTGVLNRRGFEDRFAGELARAVRTGSPLSLLLCDLDHFKRLNDRHGHAAGDDALADVAELLARSVRENDVVARWGGEEFAILLPECDRGASVVVAEKLRSRVRDARGRGRGLTVSLGVATTPPCPAEVEALLETADAALYEAKAAGRNRTVLATSAAA